MRGDLQQLTQAIEAIERRGLNGSGAKRSILLPTSWTGIDRTLGGGLQRGAVHEWFNYVQAKGWPSLGEGVSRHGWFPPLAIFIHLAWQALDQERDDSGFVIWIGRRCWPHLRAIVRNRDVMNVRRVPLRSRGLMDESALEHDRTLLERSLFIDPPDDASRLWAIDLALRSLGEAGGIVIADGSRLDMPATRRLQLAAEAGRSIALIARPPHELSELSAATTRWAASPFTASEMHGESSPRWIVQLLRCKGLRPTSALGSFGRLRESFGSFEHATAWHRWAVEWNSAQGRVNQLADVVDRPDSPTLASTGVESDDFIPATARRSA